MILSWDGAGPPPVRVHGPELVAPTEAELLQWYEEYRLRQARRLLALMPRESIRPLYREALRAHGRPGVPGDDPMTCLVRYCEDLLPLPPFEVWLEDFRRNRAEHLMDLEEAADAPTPAAPATLEARRVLREGGEFVARLRGFRDQDAWRGFIAFEDGGSGAVHTTSLIFREPGPGALRDRFMSFETATLQAFLRSTLP